MEALGSPSISRAPKGGGHAFRIPKTIVCRRQVQRQYIIVHLTELQFTASGFFPQDFLSFPPYNFVSFSFWSFFLFFFFFFFCESTRYEKQRKKNIKVTIIIYHVYKPSNEHYCVDVCFFFFFFLFFFFCFCFFVCLFVCFLLLFFCFVFFCCCYCFYFSDYHVKRL